MLRRAGFAAILTMVSLGGVRSAAAQAAPPPSADEWKIIDNSFLVEEAFNQDPHVVQNIFEFQRLTVRNWQFTFTQEFPVPRERHQLSYTIPVQALDGTSGMGDVLINYRLQVLDEGEGRAAFAPRFSVILPTGNVEAGAGTHGVQVNLPFSKHRKDVYVHWNGGVTWQRTSDGVSLTTPMAAASVIYRARQMVNLMLESVVAGVAAEATPATPGEAPFARRTVATTLSPGIRGGWNIADDKQIVIGAAVPITWAGGDVTRAVLLYFSYEGPFRGLPRK